MCSAPVLDHGALHRLGEQLEDSEVLCRFLCRYLSMLEARIARLDEALAGADQAAWMDAVLSLKTSSSMVGAAALAERAAALERESATCPSWCTRADPEASGTGTTRRAATVMRLRRLAAETAGQLRVFLQRTPASPPPE